MQVLPIIGTSAMLAGALYLSYLAANRDHAESPLISLPADVTSADQAARQISLVPNLRDDAFYAAITDRPLFQDGRRPVADSSELAEPDVEDTAPELPAQPQEAVPPDVQLLGVLAGGARTSALLSIAGDDPQWLAVGADIEGWALSEIASDHVILIEQERAHRVDLYQR